MIRFTTRSVAVLVMSLALLSVLAASAGISAKPSGGGPGNAPNAKQCQKGGWATLAPEEDSSVAFASEKSCVSHGAQGGTIFPVVPTTEDSAVTRCKEEALAAGFDPAAFDNIIAGTTGEDIFYPTAGADLICGFEGPDYIFHHAIQAGDVFLGGDGNDYVNILSGGTFNGGGGDDRVNTMNDGTFNGGDGNDSVNILSGGTFNGGAGDDVVYNPNGGTFNQDG